MGHRILVRLYHPRQLLDNGNVVLKHLKMPFSAPPWLRGHPTPLVAHPLQVVHFKLLRVTRIKWCPLRLCLRPCCFLSSSLSPSFLSLSSGFSCYQDHNDPQVYTSSSDVSSESSISRHLNLALTHRPQTGTGPAPRKTCASSSVPLSVKVVQVIPDSTLLLISIFNKWPSSDHFNLSCIPWICLLFSILWSQFRPLLSLSVLFSSFFACFPFFS